MALDKPIKPTGANLLPDDFATSGTKTAYTNTQLTNGYLPYPTPDILYGDNLNDWFAKTAKTVDYAVKTSDAVNLLTAENDLLTINSSGDFDVVNISSLTQNQPSYIPYSVNKGLTSINKVSDSSVSFTGTPTITFPNGKTYIGLTLNNITTGIVDGTLDFIIEEDDIASNAVTPKAVLSSKVNETLLDGTGGVDGDYNLNVTVKPLYPEKRTSGTWSVKQFIKIGGAVRTAGTLGAPYVYAFNRLFTSQQYTPVVNTATIVNHNLNINPLFIKAEVKLKCIIAEQGFALGDIITFNTYYLSGQWGVPTIIVKNSTIQINTASAGFVVILSSGVASPLTRANWQYIFKVKGDF